MKITGNRSALELARERFGDKAFVARIGKKFYVGVFWFCWSRRMVNCIKGEGGSWTEALEAAGIDAERTEPVRPIETPKDEAPVVGM